MDGRGLDGALRRAGEPQGSSRFQRSVGYAVAVASVALALLTRFALDPILSDRQPFSFFYVAVIISCWLGGFGPGLLAYILGLLAGHYFFIAPRLSFFRVEAGDLITVVVYLLVGLVIVVLTESMRRAERRADERARAVSGGQVALRESEARLGAIIASATDAIITLDADHRVIVFNGAAERMFRCSASEAIGQSLDRFIPAPSRAAHAEYIRGFSETGVSLRAMGGERVLSAVRADGEEFPMEAQISQVTIGGQKLFTVIIRDVSERKRAEEALRESEERFRTIADSAPMLMWLNDTSGCVFVNRVYLDFLGLHHETDVRGYDWAQYVHPDDRESYVGTYLDCVARRAQFGAEFRFRRHDGEYRWMRSVGVPRVTAAGELVGYTGCTFDIQEGRMAERERERLLAITEHARAEAEGANRAKDAFLGTISHELRTPLAPILAWTHMLRAGKLDAERSRSALEVIERSARTQAQIIEDLLDVSRIIAGKMRLEVRPVHLVPVIDAAVEVVRPAAEAKGIRLTTILDTEAGAISGDPERLQQLVWNLLSNAIKFTPKGGRVQVVLERVSSHIEVAVSDSGEGISPDFLPRVFERFQQADAGSSRAHSGLGLGLAIARHIVELHGGTVHAESRGHGQGAIFTVKLPLMITRMSGEAERRHPSGFGIRDGALPTLDGIRVLVVDDQPDTAEVVRALLTAQGAEVRTAGSTQQALDELVRWNADLLISDIGMPGEDGYALITKVRGQPGVAGRVPAIALTAYAGVDDRVRLLAAGYQMHMTKPIEPAELVAGAASLSRGSARL